MQGVAIIIRSVAIPAVIVCLVCAALVSGAEVAKDATANLVLAEGFEQWEWRPIEPSMTASGRKLLASGKTLSYEHKGPLYRAPVNFVFACGRRLEGTDAFAGKYAVRLDATNGRLQTGLHGPFGRKWETGQTYRCRVALRGEGTFLFRLSLEGVNPRNGQATWLGFPDAIVLQVTNEWKQHDVSFAVPDLSREPYKARSRASAAIVIERGDCVDVDALEIWKMTDAENPNAAIRQINGSSRDRARDGG